MKNDIPTTIFDKYESPLNKPIVMTINKKMLITIPNLIIDFLNILNIKSVQPL